MPSSFFYMVEFWGARLGYIGHSLYLNYSLIIPVLLNSLFKVKKNQGGIECYTRNYYSWV